MCLPFHIQSPDNPTVLPLANFLESTCFWYQTPSPLYCPLPDHRRTSPDCLHSSSFFSFYTDTRPFYHLYISALKHHPKHIPLVYKTPLLTALKSNFSTWHWVCYKVAPSNFQFLSLSFILYISKALLFPIYSCYFSLIPMSIYSFFMGH